MRTRGTWNYRKFNLVQGDTPDIELERLRQEGDHEAVLRHLQNLTDDLGKAED